jgi:hypothetical protein
MSSQQLTHYEKYKVTIKAYLKRHPEKSIENSRKTYADPIQKERKKEMMRIYSKKRYQNAKALKLSEKMNTVE